MRHLLRKLTFITLVFLFASLLSFALLHVAHANALPKPDTKYLLGQPSSANLIISKTLEGAPPATDWEFTVVSSTGSVTFTIPKAGGEYTLPVSAGNFTVTETPKSGYEVYDIYCPGLRGHP